LSLELLPGGGGGGDDPAAADILSWVGGLMSWIVRYIDSATQ